MAANAFIKVFKNKIYILITGGISFFIFAFAVWLPNMRLLFSLAADPEIPVAVKLKFPFILLEGIATNFTVLSASYTIITALLTGINVSLIIYEIQRHRLSQSGATMGILGIISGFLGMGCAMCGSLILTSILGTLGAAGIITALPLRGAEFGIMGVILSAISTYLLLKKINKPVVCRVPGKNYVK